MRRVTAALLHHPVLDRDRNVVTTAITNLDLHDIARSAYTFGAGFFVVHPIAVQRELVARVTEHWTRGSGARRIPDRSWPMANLRVAPDLEAVEAELGASGPVELWTTSATAEASAIEHQAARARLHEPGPQVLLIFGTGWGLAPSVHARASVILAPIDSARSDGWNHLSVRAAAAILFDRLLGAER